MPSGKLQLPLRSGPKFPTSPTEDAAAAGWAITSDANARKKTAFSWRPPQWWRSLGGPGHRIYNITLTPIRLVSSRIPTRR